MNEKVITEYIKEAFEGVEVVTADGGSFFFCGTERKMPFATIVTKDEYDSVSKLNREGVYRLNVGVSKATYVALFGDPPRGAIGAAVFDRAYDFAALDVVMPHPVYGQMCWVCVLNPSEETFEEVKELLAEGYEMAMGKAQ